MGKDYILREMDWERKDAEGIPFDCRDIMGFFNNALESGKYPYLPRKGNPITKNEIRNLWVPNKDKNISYVAENLEGRVIASATIFLNQGNGGILNVTKDSTSKVKGVGTELTRKIIERALASNIEVIVRTSVMNHPMIRVMYKLGYGQGRLVKNFEVYRGNIEGNNYDVFQWVIGS